MLPDGGPRVRRSEGRGTGLDTVRELMSGFPGVEEGTSYGTPAFRVRKKLLARIQEDAQTLVVRLDFESRDALLASEPEVYFVTDHYAGHPMVLVALPRISRRELAPVLEQAFRLAAPSKLVAQLDAAS
jgi:hypothetical protein